MLEDGLYWEGIVVHSDSDVVGAGERHYYVKFSTLTAAYNMRAQVNQ